MWKTLCLVPLGFCLTLFSGCTQNGQTNADPSPPVAGGVRQASAESSESSGESYKVKFETSRGDFVILVQHDWAPNGADRFEELIENGFYDDCRFFRVIEGFMAQVGMNGDPAVNARWQNRKIPDDLVLESNRRGYVTFAKGGPNSRTTQFFINLSNNARLDADGFPPFGKVVEGMDVVESLYDGYGDGPPQGRGPSQGSIQTQGNAYLNREFPKLDYIKRATIIK
jgi:peptidyl-prolyl cis-trans isomerase A (cyclophilin A)